MKKKTRSYGQFGTSIKKQVLFSSLDLLGCAMKPETTTDVIMELTGFDDWYAGQIARRYRLDRFRERIKANRGRG